MGAVAAVFLMQRLLSRDAQYDRRWILVVLVAVVIAALAGTLVGSLLDPR